MAKCCALAAAGDDGKWQEAVGIVGDSAAATTARDDAAREAEAKQLEVNAEKQRKRAEAWQKMQRAKAASDAAAAAEPEQQAKKWSFEDDDDDDDEPPAAADGAEAPAAAAAPAAAPLPGGLKPLADDEEDEVDPLDAFMAANDSAAAKQAAAAAQPQPMDAEGEDEIDPLDAFMAGLPAAAEPAAAAVLEATAAASSAAAAAAPAAVKAEPTANGQAGPAGPAAGAKQQQRRRAPRRYESDESSDDDEKDSSDEDDEVRFLKSKTLLVTCGSVLCRLARTAAVWRPAILRGLQCSHTLPCLQSGSSTALHMSSIIRAHSAASACLQAWARNVQAGKLSKGDRLGPADHSKIDYLHFRRNFYIEVPELARLTDEQVAERRKELDGIKVGI